MAGGAGVRSRTWKLGAGIDGDSKQCREGVEKGTERDMFDTMRKEETTGLEVHTTLRFDLYSIHASALRASRCLDTRDGPLARGILGDVDTRCDLP